LYNVTINPSAPTFTVTDTLYNEGASPFIGTVTLSARVDTVPLTPAQFSADSLSTADTLESFPAAGSYKVLHITVIGDTLPPFIVGPNTIVIWPIISVNNVRVPINPADSIYIYTYYYPLAIKESPLARMYIFETSDMLHVNFGDAENIVQQVRIYNTMGQSMYAGSPDWSANIATSGWSVGIYFCEITTESGEKRTFKFRVE
jgi:hypothetical protein